VYVPAGQASTAIVPMLAAWMASRSEQSPSTLSSSEVVVTVIVVAEAAWPCTRQQPRRLDLRPGQDDWVDFPAIVARTWAA
jgi:hypothetical protein